MYQLFYAPDTCSLAAHIVLEEVGAKYELTKIDFSKSEEQSSEYLLVNSKARVPSLITPQGILTETPAILIFIAQTFPDKKLVPFDKPFEFGKVQEFNSYLCSTLHVAHAHRMRGNRWADDPDAIVSMQKKVPESVGACYKYIEEIYLKKTWVMGDYFTVADPYLFTMSQWLENDGVDPEKFPRVIEHRSRMLERPSVKNALSAESTG